VPYYGLIDGLVTEVGSALAHGAVVAREYGLPAVGNVANVTKVIKTGDLLMVDGTKGIVSILNEDEQTVEQQPAWSTERNAQFKVRRTSYLLPLSFVALFLVYAIVTLFRHR
jgi:phosphoenolpyruvate-protein kinase (PTS system EI component)